MDPSKKVSDLNCGVQDLLLEVVDLKQEVPDLRFGGIRPNLTPAFTQVLKYSFKLKLELVWKSDAEITFGLKPNLSKLPVKLPYEQFKTTFFKLNFAWKPKHRFKFC